MKTRLLFTFGVLSVVIVCCTKKDTPMIPDPPPQVQDTLSAGWTKKVMPDSPTFFDIFFINNTGFVLSTSTIYKSVNGGSDWTPVISNGSISANVGMGSESNVAIAVPPNKIVSSRDGGISFDTTVVSDVSISDVFFVSPDVAFAAGNSIWQTTDAGLHWTKLHDFGGSGLGAYQTLYFLDQQTGWVARPEGLYKTTNAGVDWQPVNTGGQFHFDATGVVFYSDVNHGYIADASSVGASSDGGLIWNKVYAGQQAYHDLCFLDNNTGYMTDYQYIMKTTDGGLTWKKEATVPGIRFLELHFTDAHHGWACGEGGVILKFEN